MKAKLLVPLFALASAFGLAGYGASTAQATCRQPAPGIPAAIAVPANECLSETVEASGLQIYDCIEGVWTLKAPEANLVQFGKFVGNHFLGPTWQWIDGSKVKARSAAIYPGTGLGDLPWLLLMVTDHEGSGVLDNATFIQRVSTSGGKAPDGQCPTGSAPELKIPYTATYLFYRHRH
jgi:hypothetical protein